MNTTLFENVTTMQSMAVVANNGTDGLLVSGGIIVFFIIILVIMTRSTDNFIGSLAASSWAMFIIALFFWFGKLVPPQLPLGFVVIAAVSTLILYAETK